MLKSEFESKRIEAAAGNPRKTWHLYKEILFNKTKKAESAITVNGVPLDDSVAACTTVNDIFCTAGEKIATSIIAIHGYQTHDIDDLYTEHSSNNWSFQHVTADMVADVINNMPNKTSTSLDKVPTKLLKCSIVSIALVIATCFNAMVDISEYPTELLKGRLKLIHKSGSFDIDNFRGLTLLPSLSKVFEEILLQQLYSYFENLNLFVGNQFGFLKNSSCQSAALQLVDFIKSNFRKKFVVAMFIDLRKAFDTVDPKRLAKKLKRLGLSNSAVKLMLSYLQNRQTATTIGNNSSSIKNVNVGVAQGSKLGPIHFVIYINDMLRLNFIGQLVLYADDAALVYALDSKQDIQHAIQHDADLLHDWLCKNILSINAVKTCYVTFGLVIDEDLNFHAHVNHIKKQVAPFISLMWRKGKYIPAEKRKQQYFAYVQSHLSYMLPIYSECAGYKLKQLQTIQNKCIKAVYRLDRYTSTTYLYSTGLLPVSELAKFERMVCIYKMVTKNNFRFTSNSDVHGRTTRRNSHIHVFNQHSVINSTNARIATAISEYNALDSETRHLTSLKTFKNRVKLKVMQDSTEFSVISPFRYI